MERNEFIELVKKHLEGQGTQIDVAGIVPKLFLAIAEWFEGLGDLSELETEHKEDVMSAINELAELIETPHFVVSLSKSSSELKEIYDECARNLILAKNIVFFNGEDNLYYRVNGYNMVNGGLKLHTIMNSVDITITLASNGTLSVE